LIVLLSGCNLATEARPPCRAVSVRASKLTCDRDIIDIIGIIAVISIIGIIGIIGTIVGIIDHVQGQGGPYYCSRRTVLVCNVADHFSIVVY
jgi:hypothetical protein